MGPAFERLEGRLLLAMSFGPSTWIGSGEFRVADVNGDNLPDLAALSGGGGVNIRLNLGGGTFAPIMTVDTGLQDVTAFAFGDVTGDGKPDLVAADQTNGKLAVLPGRGDGTFGSPTIYSDPNITGVNHAQNDTFLTLLLADVNGDGHLDILAARAQLAGDDVFLNRRDGTFDLHADAAPIVPQTFADFDGDGTLDLAAITLDPDIVRGQLEVSRGNGDGTFQAPVLTPVPAGGVGAYPTLAGREYAGHGVATIPLDLNGDGHPDLIVTGYEAGVSVLRNDGKGGFEAPITDDVLGGGPVQIADFNGDGKPDVVYGPAIAGGVIFFLMNNGAGNLGLPLNSDGSPGQVGPTEEEVFGLDAVDLDGDGKPDVLSVSTDGLGHVGTSILFTGIHTPPTLTAITSLPWFLGTTTIPDQPAVAGHAVTLRAVASDLDPRAAFRYSSSVGTIDPSTGEFSYTPTAVGTISATITVTVTNASPPVSLSQSFKIVAKPPAPPTALLPPFQVYQAFTGVPWTINGTYLGDSTGVARATVDYGDGTGPGPAALIPPSGFTLTHTYAAPGNYTLTVTLTGPFANASTATANVAVALSGGGVGSGGVSPPGSVTSITTSIAKGAITAFDVQFNGYVANATDSSNYALLFVKTRRVKKHLVTTTKRIAIKSVSFDAATDVARIVPAGRLAQGKVNELTINTAGLIDSKGRRLGGELIADVRGKLVTIQ
jgi:hypothetical protein